MTLTLALPLPWLSLSARITSYNVCYTKLLRDSGTYTTIEALADNINQQIANNANLVGTVRATIDQGKLSFVTTDKGSAASVTVTETAGNTAGLANLGFTTGATIAGVDEGADTSYNFV